MQGRGALEVFGSPTARKMVIGTGRGAETGMETGIACESETGRVSATERGRRSLVEKGNANGIGRETGIATVTDTGTGIVLMRRNATAGKNERRPEMLEMSQQRPLYCLSMNGVCPLDRNSQGTGTARSLSERGGGLRMMRYVGRATLSPAAD